jgi:phosphate transport system substrate-binding protein
VGLITAIACNKSGTSNSASGGGNSNHITGAGSTFVYPIMTRWIQQFQQSNTAVQINYQSIGSGGGIQQLKKGLVDFGASDAPLDDKQLQEMPAIVQIPESAGPVCITYNLPSLKKPLNLTPQALAGIYLGTVKTWHDKEIASANPGVQLPDVPIVVAHRSDGSGTTNIFTTYLSAVSPEWQSKAGKGISVSWPVGIGGKGSEGVTGVVKQTEGGIGYVELTYATENNLPVAAMKNAAGSWVLPSAESASAAIDAFTDQLSKDVRTPVVNPPASAKEGYPISGFTYLLVPKQGKSAERSQVVKQFVQYIITDGQSVAPTLHYSKLPDSIVQLDKGLLEQVK